MAYRHTTRPLKFKCNKDIEEKIEAYFKHCDKTKKPYTISGMAVFLDTCRDTLLYFENCLHSQEAVNTSLDHAEALMISDTIKKAKARCLAYAEEQLYSNPRTAGIIFSMKNNYGFVDKTEVVTTSKNDLENLTDEELEELAKKLK